MGKRQFRKAAKKSICWLLILGMLVTLPQFPMTQVLAAEVNTEAIEELDVTEKEIETEVSETTETADTEKNAAETETTEEKTTETEVTETTESEMTETADTEEALSETEEIETLEEVEKTSSDELAEVISKEADGDSVEVSVSDLLQIKVDNQTVTMQLYMDGVYEAAVQLAVGQYDAELLVNGTSVATKEFEVSTEGKVYFRLQDGALKTTDEFPVKSAALTGNFAGINFKDESGNAYSIASWTPADENAELEYVGGGIYKRTFLFEELSESVEVKDGGYKIACNDGWDVSYGKDGGSDNMALTIPAGTSSLTVWLDTITGALYDSVNSTTFEVDGYAAGLNSVDGTVSLIGTVRGETDAWEASAEGYEFTKITDNLYVYQADYASALYEYKVVFDYSKWYEHNLSGNKSFTLAAPGHVVYLYNAETQELLDSVNEATDIAQALNMAATPAVSEVKSNANGTTEFITVGEENDTVEFFYAKKSDVDAEGATALKKMKLSQGKDSKGRFNGSFTTGDIFLGDEALEYVYYYEINGVKALNANAETVTISDVEYSYYTRDAFTGRTVCVPGTFPGKSWDAASNVMTYQGEGLYTYVFKNVPAANYEYKIAMGSWSENYGDGGNINGANISVTVPETQDVTIYYSDFSHFSKCSVYYTYGANIALEGTGIPAGTKFSDSRLTGVYTAVVEDMAVGTYSDTRIVPTGEAAIEIGTYEVTEQKDVTFYYDPDSGIYYSNASDKTVEERDLYFDSKDTTYKSPFGAVATGAEVTYTIDTGLDVTDVRFVVKGAARKNIQMQKTEGAETGKQRWTVTTSYDKLGEYQYFFAVYNETAAVMYGDDDGYYGTGKACDLLNLLPYDQIVYQSGYETPDWMKNAVIYQIFPERFYNGDVTNDTATSDARGNVQYEYMSDWYILPENPEQMTTNPDSYPTYAYKGDGNWSNEIYGGDLKGITKRIDYLKALGVTVIYLNPVFESISSHRYDTSDYKNIDPILGTLGDFEELVQVAEANGMHIVLDGVFNHVSDDSVYFDRYYEYLEEGTDTIGAYPYWAYVYDYMAEKNASQEEAETAAKAYFTENYGITNFDYVEWFDVFSDSTLKDDNGDEVCDTVGLRAGKPVYGYDGWWGYDSMPIIKSTNGSEYQTGTWAEEVIGKNETSTTADNSVAQYWLSKGMDGWRLDVANEVSDETWQHFRKSVKALDSDNVIIGEIWTDAVEYLMGDMYDSVMNYMFRGAAIAYAKGGSSEDATNTLERLRERYPEEAFYAMMNLVDSHDTTRLLSYLDGIDDDRNQKEVDKAFPTYENTSDEAKQKQYLVALMQFTYAGAPTVYYGDELGMVGADDPDDRRAMIWGEGSEDLVKWYARLAAIRNSYSALRTGSVEPVSGTDDAILSYVRRDDADTMLVMMNNTGAAVAASVNAADYGITAAELTDLISGTDYTVSGGTITVSVPAYNGVILTDKSHVKTITVDEESLKPGYDPAYKVTAAERAVKVTGVSLSQTSLALKAGETASISGNVVVTPENATTKTVKYYTADRKVATVDKEGTVTAVGAGTTTITVKTNDGQFAAACEVTVTGAAAEAITLSKTELELAKGKTYTLKADVTPAGTAVTWASSKKSVAAVDANGVVTAKKTGTATITATTAGGQKAECKVTVIIPAAKVFLTPAMTIKKGSSTTLTASVFPKKTTDKITWKTSNKKVVTVTKKGKIKGVKTGKATITATASSGKKATCKVTVVKSSKKSTSIKLNKKTLTVNKGAYKQLKATITKNSTDKVTWSTSNKKVATVDKNGVVVGVKKGTVTITAKTSSGKKATCKVTVKVPATKVKLNKTKVTLAKGKTVTLKATLTPASSTDKLTWSSSNKKVATVDSKGKVKAVKKGKATITVKTTSGKKATCKVTVK